MIGYEERKECAVCENTVLQEVLNLNDVPLAGYFPTEYLSHYKSVYRAGAKLYTFQPPIRPE